MFFLSVRRSGRSFRTWQPGAWALVDTPSTWPVPSPSLPVPPSPLPVPPFTRAHALLSSSALVTAALDRRQNICIIACTLTRTHVRTQQFIVHVDRQADKDEHAHRDADQINKTKTKSSVLKAIWQSNGNCSNDTPDKCWHHDWWYGIWLKLYWLPCRYHYYGIGIRETSQYYHSVYSGKGLTR